MSPLTKYLMVLLNRASASLLPFTDAFGSGTTLGARWTGATWAVGSGVATNTPTLGSELVPNPDMELDANWVARGTTVTCERSNEQAHGGTYSWKVVTDGASEGLDSGVFAQTAGNWEDFSIWVHSNPSTAMNLYLCAGNGSTTDGNVAFTPTLTTWTQARGTARITLSGANGKIRIEKGSDVDRTVYHDDASVKIITLATLLASVNGGSANVTCSAALMVATNYQAGIVVCLDSAANPQNFLLAYHNRTNAILVKYLAGVPSQLISAAAAYAAGRILKIVKSGTTVQLFYNDAQIGTDQTLNAVTDAAILASTRHGIFSTNSSNSVDDFSLASS